MEFITARLGGERPLWNDVLVMRLECAATPPMFVDDGSGRTWRLPSGVSVTHTERIGRDHPDHPAYQVSDVTGSMPEYELVEIDDARSLRRLGAPRWVRRHVTRLRPGVLLILEALDTGTHPDPGSDGPDKVTPHAPPLPRTAPVSNWDRLVLATQAIIVTRDAIYGTVPPPVLVLALLFVVFAPGEAVRDPSWTTLGLIVPTSLLIGGWLLTRGWWRLDAGGFTVRSFLWRWWCVCCENVRQIEFTHAHNGYYIGSWVEVHDGEQDPGREEHCLGLSLNLGVAKPLRTLAVAAERGWLPSDLRIVSRMPARLPTSKRQARRLEAAGMRFRVRR